MIIKSKDVQGVWYKQNKITDRIEQEFGSMVIFFHETIIKFRTRKVKKKVRDLEKKS